MRKYIKYLILPIILIISIIGISCNNDEDSEFEEEYNNYLSDFDLSDGKSLFIYEESVRSDEYLINGRIFITTKITHTYHEFKLEYLQVDEATSFDYVIGPELGKYSDLEEFR